jgi:acyl-CoA reductase-like NAD-dependent aldehyde dehydrogenase
VLQRRHRQPVAPIGGELTGNPKVRKLSFTGSTEVGRLLMAQCAPTIKKVSLELGGNAPFIVFDDADLDAAVEGAIASKYRNTGQTCVCANRLLVQDGVYDAFAQKLADRVAGLKVGSGLEEGVTQGPLIDARAWPRSRSTRRCVAKGAKVLCGGKRHALGGTFFEPTVLAGVTPAMKCAREETFGPVAPLFQLQGRSRGVRAGQRHRVRPRRLFLQPRHRALLARRRGAGVRHGRRQHRRDFQRGGALRRRQAVGPRPRRFEVTASMSTWRSSTSQAR